VPSPLLYVHNLRDRSQGLVDGLTVWKQARYVGIKDNYIRALGVPASVLTPNASGKIIMIAHFVVFTNFLLPPLEAVCHSSANYTDRFLFFSMYHNEQALAIRETHRHPALFIFRMVGIGNGDRQRIGKNSGGLSEIDPVFPQILPRLAFIPLKLDWHSGIKQERRLIVKA
jgi:hypothetical protein